MEKEEFVELEKKVFSAFVEHLKSKNQSFELRSVFVNGQEHRSLYIPNTDTTIDASAENEEFYFTSSRASLQAHMSFSLYMQSLDSLDEVFFENEAIVLLDVFLKSARIICDARQDVLRVQANVNGSLM